MADKSNQLIVDALSRALAEPAGISLHGNRQTAGLFGTTAPARQAARWCQEQGYLRNIRTETRGKNVQEICALTDKGLAYLLDQLSPKAVLENLVKALESRGAQVTDLVEATRRVQNEFESLRLFIEQVLQQLQRTGTASAIAASANGDGADLTVQAILGQLRCWRESGALDDLALPGLYGSVREKLPHLTIGQFHDALRRLQERSQIYLHPWTGPLYEIPEPVFVLMIGHEIAYYASLRS